MKTGKDELEGAVCTSKKISVLKRSLLKKEQLFSDKINDHFATVKQANGQPLNDKRNGQATVEGWRRQNDALRRLKEGIEKTNLAIETEEQKIAHVEHVSRFIPKEILLLVDSGELIRWKKHPHIFFVCGVDKARIIWDEKKKEVSHKYVHQLVEKEQRSKFAKLFNPLGLCLNGK